MDHLIRDLSTGERILKLTDDNVLSLDSEVVECEIIHGDKRLMEWGIRNTVTGTLLQRNMRCTGKIRLGELPIETLIREINEEIGLDISDIIQQLDMFYYCGYTNGDRLQSYYHGIAGKCDVHHFLLRLPDKLYSPIYNTSEGDKINIFKWQPRSHLNKKDIVNYATIDPSLVSYIDSQLMFLGYQFVDDELKNSDKVMVNENGDSVDIEITDVTIPTVPTTITKSFMSL